MRVIIFFIAGMIGVLLAKAFFFDNIEQLAWNIFWTSIRNGESNFFTANIFNSTTFLKSFLCFFIVGFAGLFSYNYYYENEQVKKRK